MEKLDLNRLEGLGLPMLPDNGCVSGPVEIVFRDHHARLLQIFDEAVDDGLVCLGAVAWLTDPGILHAMAKLPTSVVVQKEDFLRPEYPISDGDVGWKAHLQSQYAAIGRSDRHSPLFIRQNFPHPLGDMSLLGPQDIAGVRCVGMRNDRENKVLRRPLMHNKFLVFARLGEEPVAGEEEDSSNAIVWEPIMVWTGSCNLSRTAHRSLENTVIIRDTVLAEAYLREWLYIMSISEPLDWDSELANPEWKLGLS